LDSSVNSHLTCLSFSNFTKNIIRTNAIKSRNNNNNNNNNKKQVFTIFPEPEQRIWPLIKGMAIRNHLDPKILWARPYYLIADGVEAGCRELGADGVTSYPVESALCRDHCTHSGRYCHPDLPSSLPGTVTGKSLVLEALRRLCIDQAYHATDYKFFRYLEDFERAGCLYKGDVTMCSIEVIDQIDWLEYSDLESCVGSLNEIDSDVPNKKLDEQLEAFNQLNIDPATDIPSLFLGGVHYQGELTTKAIFTEYCDMFIRADKTLPVSCDICRDCDDVRRCLWFLECDGKPFDSASFLEAHGQTLFPGDEGLDGEDTETESASTPGASNAQPDDTNLEIESVSVTAIAGPSSSSSSRTQQKNSNNGVNHTILAFFMAALFGSAIVATVVIVRDQFHRRKGNAFRNSPEFQSEFSGPNLHSYRDYGNEGGYQDGAMDKSDGSHAYNGHGSFSYDDSSVVEVDDEGSQCIDYNDIALEMPPSRTRDNMSISGRSYSSRGSDTMNKRGSDHVKRPPKADAFGAFA